MAHFEETGSNIADDITATEATVTFTPQGIQVVAGDTTLTGQAASVTLHFNAAAGTVTVTLAD